MKTPKTWIYTVAAIVAAMVLLSLTGCKTVRTAETTDHRLTERLERIDSLVTRSFVSLQDSSWHERVLSQFQSIKEHSDTSHVITVDTAGNVIRERTIINNYRETISETSEREREAVRQRIEVLDSAVQAQTALIEKMDSTIHTERQQVEVPARLTWWQQFRLHLANILLYAIAIFIGWRIVRWKLKR